METTTIQGLAASKLNWCRHDTLWVLGIYGCTVSGGTLFWPISLGLSGFWPTLFLSLLASPMTYIAVTPNPQAALFGLDVLKCEGNAIDATVLAVVKPIQTSLGGDCFVLLKKVSEKPEALNGSSWSPAVISVDYFLEQGISSVDPTTAQTVTLPGAIRAWERLLLDYGTKGFSELLAPALAAASNGCPVSERLARDWGLQVDKMKRRPVIAKVLPSNGNAPIVGDTHRNPPLAKTLKSLTAREVSAFYEGWNAEDRGYITDVDCDGTVVSFINSIFDDFGSGIVAPAREHYSRKKRPMHTIIPTLLTCDDEAVMLFGVTGGHFQPAGQMQLLLTIVDYGMSVQKAIDHPRMFARGDLFELEKGVPDATLAGLIALGHQLLRTLNPLSTSHAIWIDKQSGVLRGGSDPRRNGIALGY